MSGIISLGSGNSKPAAGLSFHLQIVFKSNKNLCSTYRASTYGYNIYWFEDAVNLLPFFAEW